MKHSLKDIFKICFKKGGICLTNNYINCKQYIEILCFNNHYFSIMAQNLFSGTWCIYCHNLKKVKYKEKNDSSRIIKYESKDNDKYKNSIRKGDENEDKICDILKEKNILFERQGHKSNNIFDIYIKFDNITRGIQVKTFRKHNKNNQLGISFHREYPNDMLFVLLNYEYNIYMLIFKHQFNIKHISISLNKNNLEKSKFYKFIYNDYNEFKDKLIEFSKLSTNIDCVEKKYSDNCKLEKESIERLIDKCKELGLFFEYNTTNSNVYDCIINGYKIQCKYVSLFDKQKNYFHFKLRKSFGNHYKVPYNINDTIDFFILEMGGSKNDPSKYHKNFFIISKNELNEKGYISDDKIKGKEFINIFPPDYQTKRKSVHNFTSDKKYWDLNVLK